MWNLKSRNMEVLRNALWYGPLALVSNPSPPFSELLALNPFSPPPDVAVSFLYLLGWVQKFHEPILRVKLAKLTCFVFSPGGKCEMGPAFPLSSDLHIVQAAEESDHC